MKIQIDWGLCQGHANCTGDAPDVFEIDDEGKLKVLMPEPTEEFRSQLESAVRYCPTGAIRVEG